MKKNPLIFTKFRHSLVIKILLFDAVVETFWSFVISLYIIIPIVPQIENM